MVFFRFPFFSFDEFMSATSDDLFRIASILLLSCVPDRVRMKICWNNNDSTE